MNDSSTCRAGRVRGRSAAPVIIALLMLAVAPAARAQQTEAPAFQNAPYVQNLAPDGITVMWRATVAAKGEVLLAPAPDGQAPANWQRRARRIAPAGDPSTPPALSEAEGLGAGSAAALQRVRLDRLQPDTSYVYEVRLAGGATSAPAVFRTAPKTAVPFEFVIYGDTRADPAWAQRFVKHRHAEVIASIRQHSPAARFVIHTGDFVLLGKEPERWDGEFFAPAAPLLAEKVLFPAIGNHEQAHASYFERFEVPGPPAGKGGAPTAWYSFDFAHAHFVVLDVPGYASGGKYGPEKATPLDPDSPQYRWLAADLERTEQPWIFAVFHAPAFSSGGDGNYQPAVASLVPLFERHGVDAVFAGHDHVYEVSVKDAMVHLVTGGGGAMISPLGPRPGNPYSQVYKGTWHHCRVRIDGTKFVSEAVNLDGSVFHRVMIDKTGGARRVLLGPPGEEAAPKPPAAPAPAKPAGEQEY